MARMNRIFIAFVIEDERYKEGTPHETEIYVR